MKTIWLDYVGTVLKEDTQSVSPILEALRMNKEEGLKVVAFMVESFHTAEKKYQHKTYRMMDVVVQQAIDTTIEHFGLDIDPSALFIAMQNYWMYGDLHSDAIQLLQQSSHPIYIISGVQHDYIHVNLKRQGLHVHDILTSDTLLVYPFQSEFFIQALEHFHQDKDSVIVISERKTIVESAQKAGLEAYVLDRKASLKGDGAIHSLMEIK